MKGSLKGSAKEAEKTQGSSKASTLNTKRPFRATEPDASLEAERSMTKRDWKTLGAIMVIAAFVRLRSLDWPSSIVFDEVHFGGFAKKYIIGRFFFDLHPPLAKMLFAVFAFLGGFDPDSDFEFDAIGKDYIGPHIPYLTMRLLPSLAGLATIALCYATLRASGCRTSIAGTASLALTFENTFVTESRYILLDSPLILFIAITVYAYKRFENTVPFHKSWFRYLLLTGLGLGATVSSKWVGFFTIGWVGSLTVYQLWWIWGDLNVSVPRFVKHFTWRMAFLLLVPFAFYVGMFVLHFFCVDNMGDGAEMLPRWFQASLKHNRLPTDVPADVAFGSLVSLRHVDTHGGWLHSHVQTYPTGSEQQQVTLYGHVDDNNIWRIENGTEEWKPENHEGPVFVKNNDIIRLQHVATERHLHSHDHRAPVSSQDYIFEVSGYGFEGFDGDYNDNWRVKIVDKKSIGVDAKDHLQALRTYFQLEHTMLGCLLYSKNVKLPEWGFEQQEVSCIRGGKLHNTLWFIESNINPDLPAETPKFSYVVPSFWQKFVALNKLMWTVNKDLTESHYWESRPTSWVLLKRGINMWGESNRQVYLLGNLPIYWAIAASIALLVGFKLFHLLRWQHIGDVSFFPKNNSPWALFDHQFGNYALGWWFHLFPSFFMVRQLFLHHYLASLYFGILMIGQSLELLVTVVKPVQLRRIIPGAFLTLVVAWYIWYSPLIYGKPWTKSLCERSKFFDMDFDCNLFYEDLSPYKQQEAELKESRYSAYHGLLPTSATATEEPDISETGNVHFEYLDSEVVNEEIVNKDAVNEQLVSEEIVIGGDNENAKIVNIEYGQPEVVKDESVNAEAVNAAAENVEQAAEQFI